MIQSIARQNRAGSSENTALSDTGGGEETGGESSTDPDTRCGLWSRYGGLQLAEVSTAGFQFLAELSKGPVCLRNQRLPLDQQRRHACVPVYVHKMSYVSITGHTTFASLRFYGKQVLWT